MNILWNNFNNYGCLMTEFNEEDLSSIKKEIQHIQNNLETSVKFNHRLAGYIKKEYLLTHNHNYIESLLFPLIEKFENLYSLMKNKYDITLTPTNIKLDNVWVNFQKKNEYNPMHKHSGIYSFVIWISIPYLIEEEKKEYPDMSDSENNSACFCFHYTNNLGEITSYSIPVDKTFENKVLIFPSLLNHSVNPFKTSNDYRISISGNFKLVV